MKSQYIFLIMILVLFSACTKNKTSCYFRVINKTNNYLNYVEVSNNFDSIKYENEIKADDTLSLNLIFSKDLPMGDGNYFIKYANKSNDTITHSFGYYTNAKPSNNFAYQIIILGDSINVNEYQAK